MQCEEKEEEKNKWTRRIKKHISEKHFNAICFITVDVVFASRPIERALANPFDAIFANTQRALACDKEKHASIGHKQFDIEFMCVCVL